MNNGKITVSYTHLDVYKRQDIESLKSHETVMKAFKLELKK